jgi:hypothetical protein
MNPDKSMANKLREEIEAGVIRLPISIFGA